jgi:hypothetical protein
MDPRAMVLFGVCPRFRQYQLVWLNLLCGLEIIAILRYFQLEQESANMYRTGEYQPTSRLYLKVVLEWADSVKASTTAK